MDLASLPIPEARTHLLNRATNAAEWMAHWQSREAKGQVVVSDSGRKAADASDLSALREASALRKGGNSAQAALRFNSLIAQLEAKQGPGVVRAEAHAGLAVTYQESGLWEGALKHYMLAIDFYQTAGADGNALVLVTLYNNLAMVCRQLGRTEEAELAYVTAIEMHDAHLGILHADSLISLYANLAYLYHDIGLCRAAFEMQRLVAEVTRKQLPDDKIGLVHALRKAGIFAATAGEAGQAVRCFEHSRNLLSKLENAPESTHTELLINEATACLSLERTDEALALYERAAVAIQSRTGSDDLLLALVENNIGCLLLKKSKYDDAVAALMNSHDLQRNHPAADLTARAEVLHNLALAYDGIENRAAAAAYRDSSRQLLELVSDETKQRLSAAQNTRSSVPSHAVTREANPAERAYVRLPSHVPMQRRSDMTDAFVIPLRTETIDWL